MVDPSLYKNYEDLGNRIIVDAMNDYTQALRLLNRPNLGKVHKAEADATIKTCKRFFRSKFFDAICALDCEVLERIAERKAEEGCNRYYGTGKTREVAD